MDRYAPFLITTLAALVFLGFGLGGANFGFWLAGALSPFIGLGVWDLVQTRHSLLRNYPLAGHLRWLFEGVRPQIRQYLIESDEAPVPFSREQRALAYARAKGELDKRPFGTEVDVNEPGFSWLTHTTAPLEAAPSDSGSRLRVKVGNGQCLQPYDASLFNISAMSFGSLGANAILALNKGAAMGGFAHDTGEGGVSPYHRRHDGDLIWEIGSGYFGCRTAAGHFDPDRFSDEAARAQIKMIEIKLSQGAKPGHGGVLPAAKISAEIARTRGVPMGVDCISPRRHQAFETPIGLLHFVQSLRERAGGKPVGLKLCIGYPVEFMAIVKAMRETEIVPDFIVVDGKEGGTGAAPLEFANHVGMPLREGLVLVRDVLVGAGLRDQVRIAASGKIISAFDLIYLLALGADWGNAARGFMFALGCIQGERCHTNECPVGVATQDPWRQRALVIDDKAERVARFHRLTLEALAELLGAAGLDDPSQLRPDHIFTRRDDGTIATLEEHYPTLELGEFLDGAYDGAYRQLWAKADARRFVGAG